jgi:RNA polymerase sigma-70 factor (ECF subfamily)
MIAREEIESRWTVVRAVIRSRIRDPHLAEDLSQEVLLKCCRYFRDKGEVPPEGYVVQMALNECRSSARKRLAQRRPEGLSKDTEDTKQKEPVTTLEEREESRMVSLAFNALPPRYRETARLSLLDEWTARQIAEMIGLPVDTVKTRVRRARDILQNRLKVRVLDRARRRS